MLQPILKINLTTREISRFSVPGEWTRDFLGAASLAARMLYDHITPELDPLSPEAPLLILNGPLTGTAGPAVGRFVICAKSPATGLWGESNVGGFWGPELRKAGFDGLWLEGRSETPVYLWIHDQQVEIRDASHLWGKETYETQDLVAEEVDAKNVRVAVIGPAGENLIPFALVLTDHGRVAGRTGMGAVMGAKNVKAMAVKGTQDIPVIDWAEYKPLRSQSNRYLVANNQTVVMREMGTSGAADYFDYLGSMPKKYYSSGTFEGAPNVSGATMAETIGAGVSACHACVIACGRVVRLSDGEKRKGPEYETIIGFGPNLLSDDLARITMLGELCDRYGLDSISMSNIIGLAYKLFDDGIISESDTGGFSLEWGDLDGAERCIHLTAAKDGFGALLARGARDFGMHFSSADEAVQVNNLELAYHDPRGLSGMALSYATSPRGGCHNQSDYFEVELGKCDEELGLEYFSRHAGPEKSANVARHQDWRTVCNSLVLCVFSNITAGMAVDLTNAACGLDLSVDELMKVGERGWNLKRAINNRLGLTRANDRLPKALLKPYEDGGAAGYVPPFDAMLQAYYQARGWDAETGYPTPKKLTELGLEWMIPDLWPEPMGATGD